MSTPLLLLPRRRILVGMAGLSATGLLAACGESSPAELAIAEPLQAPAASSSPTPSSEVRGVAAGGRGSDDGFRPPSFGRYKMAEPISTEAKDADVAKAASVAASTGIGTDGDKGELLLLSNDSPHITTIDILTEEIALALALADRKSVV